MGRSIGDGSSPRLGSSQLQNRLGHLIWTVSGRIKRPQLQEDLFCSLKKSCGILVYRANSM